MNSSQNPSPGTKSKFGVISALLVCGLDASSVSNSLGAAIFSDGFNSYTNGNLSGQGPWTATAAAATPMQVANGRVQLGTSGQDEYAALSSAINSVDGTSFYYGLTVNLLSAQATGDYFFHVSNPAGTTTFFYERLFARSSGAGFQIGFVDTSGTGSTITWGSTVLSLGTDYRVVVAQNFVAGANNDTFAVYVNPTDTSVAANNTAYLTHTWTSQTAESLAYAAINLRQGSATAAAALFVDDVLVSQAFSDVAAVPEPASMGLMTLGGLAMLGWIRRRK